MSRDASTCLEGFVSVLICVGQIELSWLFSFLDR